LKPAGNAVPLEDALVLQLFCLVNIYGVGFRTRHRDLNPSLQTAKAELLSKHIGFKIQLHLTNTIRLTPVKPAEVRFDQLLLLVHYIDCMWIDEGLEVILC